MHARPHIGRRCLQGTTLDASLADELDRMQRAPQNSCDRVLRMHRSLVKWRRQVQRSVISILGARSGLWVCMR